MKQYSSQMRETLEEAGYELVGSIGDGEVVVKEDDGEYGMKVYFENDHHAGYTLEIGGVGCEFARTASTAEVAVAECRNWLE